MGDTVTIAEASSGKEDDARVIESLPSCIFCFPVCLVCEIIREQDYTIEGNTLDRYAG